MVELRARIRLSRLSSLSWSNRILHCYVILVRWPKVASIAFGIQKAGSLIECHVRESLAHRVSQESNEIFLSGEKILFDQRQRDSIYPVRNRACASHPQLPPPTSIPAPQPGALSAATTATSQTNAGATTTPRKLTREEKRRLRRASIKYRRAHATRKVVIYQI